VSLAFAPGDARLASSGGSEDGKVRIWDVENGTLLHTLEGQPGVLSVAFSGDGSLLASGSSGTQGDRTVRMWDLETGELLHTLEGHSGGIESMAFDPGDRILASTSCAEWGEFDQCLQDETRLWDVHTGEQLTLLRGHRTGVCEVLFNPDGTVLATRSCPWWNPDYAIVLWGVSDLASPICYAIASARRNMREGPGTDYPIGDTRRRILGYVTGYSRDDTGYKWWLLDNGLWVREDGVKVDEVYGDCDSLPEVNP
jgi:WD40 repeat protein